VRVVLWNSAAHYCRVSRHPSRRPCVRHKSTQTPSASPIPIARQRARSRDWRARAALPDFPGRHV
jgi:hypothetical protein